MSKKIEEILQGISNDILNEEVKTSIATSFNEAVDSKVEDRAQLLLQNELKKVDEVHTEKLQKLIESIDNDHVNKFKQVIQKIDASHTKKLQTVIEKFETELKVGAANLRKELTTKLSKYLDKYLESAVPTSQLKEAVENIRARKMMDEIKKIVAVDPEYISENFKDALKDGHDIIEKLRGDMDKIMKESIELKQSLQNKESELLIERKTRDLPSDKKQFITKILEGKKVSEIEENFQFVLEMCDKDEEAKISKVAEQAKKVSKVVVEKIDTPNAKKEEVVVESESSVDQYLEGLK